MESSKYEIKYHPETKEELKALVENISICLGEIDTSKITDMSELFSETKRKDFSGINRWDVSNVETMEYMFLGAESFNQDISSWNVSNVANMSTMFAFALSFNKDLSKWKVADNVTKEGAFWGSPLENNLPTWFNKK